jgi:hypothetical protein
MLQMLHLNRQMLLYNRVLPLAVNPGQMLNMIVLHYLVENEGKSKDNRAENKAEPVIGVGVAIAGAKQLDDCTENPENPENLENPEDNKDFCIYYS